MAKELLAKVEVGDWDYNQGGQNAWSEHATVERNSADRIKVHIWSLHAMDVYDATGTGVADTYEEARD